MSDVSPSIIQYNSTSSSNQLPPSSSLTGVYISVFVIAGIIIIGIIGYIFKIKYYKKNLTTKFQAQRNYFRKVTSIQRSHQSLKKSTISNNSILLKFINTLRSSTQKTSKKNLNEIIGYKMDNKSIGKTTISTNLHSNKKDFDDSKMSSVLRINYDVLNDEIIKKGKIYQIQTIKEVEKNEEFSSNYGGLSEDKISEKKISHNAIEVSEIMEMVEIDNTNYKSKDFSNFDIDRSENKKNIFHNN